jgi:intracellular sulfur oxidation DsrE/DsrF family protein
MKNCVLVIAVLALGTLMFRGWADAQEKGSRPEGTKMLKAVIHVNFADTERQKHGLKNISNILKEAKAPSDIEVVCHGAGISLLVKEKSSHGDEVSRLMKAKVRFAACENTMKEKGISKEQLLPGVETVPSGAFEVIKKQQEGFGYFRP